MQLARTRDPSRVQHREGRRRRFQGRLIDTRDFTFYRETTLSEVRELTENRFYSTLSRYPESEFGRAYARFIANLKSNYEDPNKIRYPSSYSMFLYEVWPSAA